MKKLERFETMTVIKEFADISRFGMVYFNTSTPAMRLMRLARPSSKFPTYKRQDLKNSPRVIK